MPKYNAMFDVAFSVETECKDPDSIPFEVLIAGMEARLDELKENPSEAFGFCDQFEV
jgi:hypothetical protein